MREIVEVVCKFYDVNAKEFYGKRRPKNLIKARQAAYYILKNKMKMTYTDIGNLLGRHHATIIHGVKKIEFQKEMYEDIRDEIRQLEHIVNREKIYLDNPDIYQHLSFQIMMNFPETIVETDISENDLTILAERFKITIEYRDMLIMGLRKKKEQKEKDKINKKNIDELNKNTKENIKPNHHGKETFGL